MANFFMRKLIMTVMLALVMIRLNEVQANDSPPTRVSHPFKAENMHKTFSSCLESKFEDCKTVARVRKTHVRPHCIINSFKSCKQIKHPHDPMHQKAIDAKLLCLKNLQTCKNRIRTLLRDCFLRFHLYTKSKI